MTDQSKPEDMRPINIVQSLPTSWLDPIDIARTGLQTFLAGLFGSFADKREVLAALYPRHEDIRFDYSKEKQIWFDYIADTGDGWHPTYSIACLAGESGLKVQGTSEELKRGRFVLLGGDQVYPVASAEQYRDRLEGPFFCARITKKDETDRIPVYALPGNHDWYDGLTSFIRLFCQQDRWVGQWTAKQTRSYFAIKLPHKWWIWGLDVQLESDLDVPQVNYFKYYADKLEPGDQVILVSPEPTWIEVERKKHLLPRVTRLTRPAPRTSNSGDLAAASSADRAIEETSASRPEDESVSSAHRNMVQLERLIYKKGATIPVKIAGDLHHYARYIGEDGQSTLMTCGGGGAFLHGTYGLPESLDVQESTDQKFTLKQVVPSVDESKGMRKCVVLKLIPKNPWFAVAVGAIYWVYSWLLQSTSEILNTPPWDGTTLLEYLRTDACPVNRFLPCGDVFRVWADLVFRDPGLFLFTSLILVGCAAFAVTSRRPGSSKPRTCAIGFLGLLHGAAHIALALILIKIAANGITENWIVHIATLPMGVIPGPLLMAIYLWFANVLLQAHDQEVLSTQAIIDHKCFARFHVTEKELTIYPIGLDKVCTKWKLADKVVLKKLKLHWFGRLRWRYHLEAPRSVTRIFEPEKGYELNPRLFDGPIKISSPPKATTGSP